MAVCRLLQERCDAMKRNYDICNEAPSYLMWRIMIREGSL